MRGNAQSDSSSLNLEENVESDENRDFHDFVGEDYWSDGAFVRARSYKTLTINQTRTSTKGNMKESQQHIQPLNEGILPRYPISMDIAAGLLDEDELEEVEAILRANSLPDNKEYARVDSIYQFLEQFLLPRMRIQEPLTGKELVGEAYEYRKAFKQQYPMDFDGSFQFLPSVGLALTQLQLYYRDIEISDRQIEELANLVRKAAVAFDSLVKEDATAIYYP